LSSQSSGLLEVYSNGNWGSICGPSWNKADAQAVCGQLTFAPVTNYYLGSEEEGLRHIWMGNVSCRGSETKLGHCTFSGWNSTECPNSRSKGVECASSVAPVSLRLVGGPTHNSGRLEVFHGGAWGTVCDDLFNSQSVKVACRQLGYTGGHYRAKAHFGAGSGLIWMDNVRCRGSETTLTSCHFPGWGVSDCSHNEDVGLECAGTGKM
jgi:hypothetical protein